VDGLLSWPSQLDVMAEPVGMFENEIVFKMKGFKL
jgi:hypothetical protein